MKAKTIYVATKMEYIPNYDGTSRCNIIYIGAYSTWKLAETAISPRMDHAEIDINPIVYYEDNIF